MRSKDVFFLGEQGALYSLTKNKVKVVFSIVSLFFVQVDDIKAVLFFVFGCLLLTLTHIIRRCNHL